MTENKKDKKEKDTILPTSTRLTAEEKSMFASLLPKIPGYQILSTLGEGGCGIVYLADQKEPVKRRVALKVIKPGMDSRQVIARFEAERQALALLDHPNISQVFSAGTTEAGRPFFVMEYVKGVPITEHCDRHKLKIEDRLDLFLQVCDAIQHAHQKGIIHRDIKPSNILVSIEGDSTILKVIDFGVAKAINQSLTERTLFTEQGQLIGTPEYMSPEQAEMTAQNIDTRSDIYSLGILLYELLTGSLPFDKDTLRKAAFGEIQRIIRQQDPPSPSARLSGLGEEATKVAESRQTEVKTLAKRLHKELEWIPLKAMRKEPNERYRSASEFADDIKNYLKGTPLIAGPESVGYQVKKFVKRNRMLVTSVVIVLAAVLAGTVASTIFAIRESRARVMADTERNRAAEAQQETQQANEQLSLENYTSTISIASNSIAKGNLGHALQLLAKCPEKYRHWEWGYLQQLCNNNSKIIKSTSDNYYSISASPDGKIAVSDSSHQVSIWNNNMDKVLKTIPGKYGCFSPDGQYLAIAGSAASDAINVWGADQSKIVKSLEGNKYKIFQAAFSHDSKLFAVATQNSTVMVWDVESEKLIHTLETEKANTTDDPDAGNVRCLAFSPDGRYLTTGSDDHGVRLWNVKSGILIKSHYDHHHLVIGVGFSPDSKYVISSAYNNDILCWDCTKDSVWPISKVSGGDCVKVSPDQKYLAVGVEGAVRVFDMKTLKVIHDYINPIGLNESFVFGHQSDRIIACTSAGNIIVWEMHIRNFPPILTGHTGNIRSLAFSPDGRYLASSAGNWNLGNDQTVKIWSMENYQQIHTLRKSTNVVCSVEFSPDGKQLAAGSQDHNTVIWNTKTATEIETLRGHQGWVNCLDYHPDGSLLATGSLDNSVKIWNTKTFQTNHTLNSHTRKVNSVKFSPDGSILASASWDKRVILWDPYTGRELKQLVSDGAIDCMDISPDGSLIASAGRDKNITLWDIATGKAVKTLTGHKRMVMDIAFSPDGKRLFSTARNASVKVWDISSGREVLTIESHVHQDPAIAISPNGKSLAMGQGHDIVILDAFPWKESEYPGDSSMSLQDRIELYKRQYWIKRNQFGGPMMILHSDDWTFPDKKLALKAALDDVQQESDLTPWK